MAKPIYDAYGVCDGKCNGEILQCTGYQCDEIMCEHDARVKAPSKVPLTDNEANAVIAKAKKTFLCDDCVRDIGNINSRPTFSLWKVLATYDATHPDFDPQLWRANLLAVAKKHQSVCLAAK